MGLPAQKTDQKFTYGDYYSWLGEERWELINGHAYNMRPAPSRTHQRILTILISRFNDFFEDKNCEVYAAPFDVRLPKSGEVDEMIDTVVQPDLSVICDTSKLDEKGCKGAPDLVVEILSPGGGARDMKIKRELYEEHGVKEYWIVLPPERVVEVYSQDKSNLYGRPQIYGSEDTITTALFPGLEIKLERIFPLEETGEKSDGPKEKRV